MLDVLRRYKNWLALSCCAVLVTAWTLFRLFTKPVNFDMTGQQLLARQWLEGYNDGSVMAPTNYIIKMVLFYLPAEILGADPHITLIAVTIAINIATFIGLYVVLKKLLEYFDVPVSSLFYGGMLWLATVAGSVFWIQFSNSRNLELVLGLFLLYLCLLLYKKATAVRAAGAIALAGLTFFADPMQLYMIPAILISFIAADTLLTKKSWAPLGLMTVCLVAGFGIAEGLTFLVQQLTHVSFFNVSSLQQSLTVLSHPADALLGAAKNTMRLLAGTNEFGVWRQVLNLMLIGGLVMAVIIALAKKRLPRRPVVFAGVWFFVVIGVYVASGQSVFEADTSRYVILLAPLVVFAGSLLAFYPKVARAAVVILGVVVLANATSLLWSTTKHWSGALPADALLKQRVEYVQNNGFSYGYASMDTAIPGTYLFGRGKPPLLPLSCADGRLHRATLFYDKKVFTAAEAGQVAAVPLLLDGSAVGNYPHRCDHAAIIRQFGQPIRQEQLDSGDTVFIYPAAVIANNLQP